MTSPPTAAPRRAHAPLAVLGGIALVGVALGMRLNNALRYPPDWGFDASFNWRYIYRMSQDWALPDPAAGWSTGDPPLYFVLAAAVFRGLDALGAQGAALHAVPLLGTGLGLVVVWLAFALVRRADPARTERAWLAAALLLYLPAHIHMSVMVSEEMLMALFTSLTVFALVSRTHAAATGVVAGLAALSKLSGTLAVATGVATYAIDGLRRAAWRPAGRRVAAFLGAALLAGGWYYARNQLVHGYVQPFALPAHEIMFEMPPGERGIGDYLRVPLATWTDPQLLNPDLLRSVWGGTYASVWFDAHRAFLPVEGAGVRRLGTLTLLLALLPTLAFGLGAWRGLRRVWNGTGAVDLPLLLLSVFTLAGYAVFTWRNPWFATVKGTTLLGLALPFSWYASEVLWGWLRRRDAVAWGVGIALGLLGVCVSLSCTFNGMFEKTEVSGLPWQAPGPLR